MRNTIITSFRRRQSGVTLLEALLVMMVGAAIVMLGVRQYQSYRQYADVNQLASNIDQLFQGAAFFYRANCANTATLGSTTSTATTYPINITTDLVNGGYLSATVNRSPLVDTTGGWDGYSVQFNKFTSPRMVNVCSNPPACTTSVATQIGTSVNWSIQVAVRLRDSSKSQAFKGMMDGQCVTSQRGTGLASCSDTTYSNTCQALRSNPMDLWAQFVASWFGCPAAGAAYNNYVVFERMPSFATPEKVDLWGINPLTTQFKQLYTTNPITNLTSTSHTTEYQYFMCGS